MTAAEKTTLAKCESDLQTHADSFRLAGAALQTIRDSRLYRETHATFEAYCRERWSFSKTQANRLISATHVVNLAADVIPANIAAHLSESAVRSLTGLSDKESTRVLKRVVKSIPAAAVSAGIAPPITAKMVASVARAVVPAKFPKRETAPTTSRKPAGDFVRRSEVLEAIDAWAKKENSKLMGYSVSEVIAAVKKLIETL